MKIGIKLYFSFLMCVMLLGCNLFNESESVHYGVLAQGSFSGIHNRTEQVITGKAQWESFWGQHTSYHRPAEPLPPVDFGSFVVAAIIAGDKPTSGYQIVVTQVFRSEREIVVTYRISSPTGPTMEVLTQPFTILKIAKPEGSVKIMPE